MLFILLYAMLNIACVGNGKQEQVQSTYVIDQKKKPAVLDSATVMQHTADELIEKIGKPLSDSIFQVRQSDRRRRFLYDYLSCDSNKTIREQTWRIDSVNRLNIWFIKKDNVWNPLIFQFYMFDDDF